MTQLDPYAVVAVSMSTTLLLVYGRLAWGYFRWWRRWHRDKRSSLAFLSSIALTLFALAGIVDALSHPAVFGPTIEAEFLSSVLRGGLLTIGIVLLLARRARK